MSPVRSRSPAPTGQDDGTVGPAGSVSYAVNGGRTEFNNWEIDGGEVLDSGSNANINVYPNIDAIAEVRVLTSTYGAQYGRNGAGTIEAVTKSGTNQFHGEAFEFIRNAAFNAHNYFDLPGSPKAYYNKNDYRIHCWRPHQEGQAVFLLVAGISQRKCALCLQQSGNVSTHRRRAHWRLQ
jgi:hypothetical protein